MRLVLVTDQLHSPYSGMLPGHIAGLYRRDEMHIDLAGLARATGTTLIHARAIGIDPDRKIVILHGREPAPYALASINVGITPDLSAIQGAEQHGIAVKPISTFLNRFDAMMAGAVAQDGPRHVAIVGNGPAGVELAFALAANFRRTEANARSPGWQITLIGSGEVVQRLNWRARRRVEKALDRHGVRRIAGARVVSIEPEAIETAQGQRLPVDATLISTRARAPRWLASTGLPLGRDGSISTSATLQVIGRPDIFAVGDCAEIVGEPREKAGVFAVRQGPALARNIRLAWRGAPLPQHEPQTHYLVLLMTGDRSAIGARGRWLAVEGRWVWWLKDWIDRRFMTRFTASVLR